MHRRGGINLPPKFHEFLLAQMEQHVHTTRAKRYVVDFEFSRVRYEVNSLSARSTCYSLTREVIELTGLFLIRSDASSLCGYTAWLLTKSRTLGRRITMLPGEASRNARRGPQIFPSNRSDGVLPRSPIFIDGCAASMNGPT